MQKEITPDETVDPKDDAARVVFATKTGLNCTAAGTLSAHLLGLFLTKSRGFSGVDTTRASQRTATRASQRTTTRACSRFPPAF